MNNIEKKIDKVMRFLMAMSMLGLVIGGTWQIFSRLIIGNPSTATDEILRFLLIWAGMIGSAYCFYKNEHLALDLITNKVKGVPAKVLFVFIEVMVLLFVGYVFVYGGLKLTLNSSNSSAVLHIPYKMLYSILPISGVFIIIARILVYLSKLGIIKESEENK